ncbi:GNAT family N-acetyltransferase [Rhizobacter sp. SG703]|uniref:GNAT family N-acetyltransferase n=1 Tax=Rhizobacter sp. SG703 TaxID=2587140 RepID=UPI0014454DE1|nr:GNAT family N-acetyltransferase [Rhizobacter sp. SG703]NKI96239.1 GNAT superfamily N-acetyltransferase [Rhizobacter sp. SG703]
MTKEWTLRAVRADDAPGIARHRYHRSEPEYDVDAYAAWLPMRIERGTYIGFVAEAAGRVVGGAGAVLLDWGPTRGEASGTRARIVNVFTDAQWRMRGIAKALVGEVMATCTESGIRVFNLAASAEGAHLYRSLGFKPYADEMILRCHEPATLDQKPR